MRLAWYFPIAVLLLLLALVPGAARADYVGGLNPEGDNFLALRSGPGTSYSLIIRMGPDTLVTVIRQRGSWLEVELEDGTVGWAFGAYIREGFPPGYEEPMEEGVDDEGAVPEDGEDTQLAGDDPPDEAPFDIVARDWTGYINDRFGTAIEYPASLFEMLPAPDINDGRTFEAPGVDARFIVYGAHNVFGKTIDELRVEDIAASDDDVITYQRSGADWYVLSGNRGSAVFYRRIMLPGNGEVIHTFEITYPRAQRSEFDEIAARMALSMTAGEEPTTTEAEVETEIETGSPDIGAPAPEPQTATINEKPEELAAPQVAPDAWRAPLEEVLFAGTQTPLFLPHQAHGGVFDLQARYEDGALVVDVPAGNGWGKVGLLSNDALVWLDDFHDDAEVRVTFTLDPERTTGFGLALTETGWGGVRGNDPGYPGVRFYWIRSADGSSARRDIHIDPHRDADFWSDTASSEAPTEIIFVLRPGTVTIEVDGAVIAERPAAFLRDGAGLRVYAFSHVAEVQGPAKMALRGISVARHYPTVPRTPDGPAEGVAPLPVETLFSGEPTDAFEPAAVAGGNFDEFAHYANGALVVDVPAGHSWGKTGLISAEPLVHLDDRARQTPLRLTLTVDPDQTATFTLALAGDKVAEMWPGHIAWFALTLMPETGDYRMSVHASAYNDRFRTVPAAWVDAYWDGTLVYDIADNLACMRMPPGPSLCAMMPTGVGGAYYATIMAHAPVADAPTSLVLRSITRGLVTPPGMTADRRWYFVDDEAFDPDQFLEELGSLLQ